MSDNHRMLYSWCQQRQYGMRYATVAHINLLVAKRSVSESYLNKVLV